MTPADFKADRMQLIGKRVQLNGVLKPFVEGEALLMAGDADLAPVFVDVARLTRDQRRRMLQCDPACPSTVTGRVGTVAVGQIGIIADDIGF